MSSLPSTAVFLLYVGAFALAATASFAAAVSVRRVADDDTRRGLLALLLASGGWASAHVGFLVSPGRSLQLGWYVTGMVLGLAAVGAWLYFCSAYTNRTLHRDRRYRRLAVGVFVALVSVKVTNPLHHGYFVTTAVDAPFPHLAVATGPLHWVAMGLSYALAFVGYFMLLELFTEIDLDTRPLLALVGVTGLPVVADVVGYATPLLLDITYGPLGVAVFAVGIAFVYRDRFETVRLAAEQPDPVVALDADGRVRDTNGAARALFDDLATARGEPLATALPTVAERLDDEDPLVELSRDGQRRSFRVAEAPYGTRKAGLGSTLVFTDVTERERSRRELQRQNERLERFASLVSHDLRNPLNVAQGNLERLRADPSDEARAEDVAVALDRMETLIEEILTLARQGQQVETWDAVRLSTVAEDCWGMVDTGDLELVVGPDCTFEADPTRLKRLFENCFRNVVEHGTGATTVTVGSLPDGEGFAVTDDGVGIPEGDRETVFDAGYSTGTDGTGFGLAIVADIVAAHGWSINATEGVDGGARFEVLGVTVVD